MSKHPIQKTEKERAQYVTGTNNFNFDRLINGSITGKLYQKRRQNKSGGNQTDKNDWWMAINSSNNMDDYSNDCSAYLM